MKSESPVVDRTSVTLRLQPPPPQSQPSKIILADLNVDPPDSDGNDYVPVAAVSPTSFSRVIADEIFQDKLKKDIEVADTEGKQLKKMGKCRSRMGKLDCPPDCSGADAEPDHNVQGVPSSREEKVSSLKTGLIHVARKMPKNAHSHFVLGLMYQRMGQPQKAILAYEKAEEILVRPEEEIDRPELLSLVQVHRAQCILLGTLEDCSSDEELDPEELENILAKLKEAVKSDVTQVSIWNALGIILLRTGRLQFSQLCWTYPQTTWIALVILELLVSGGAGANALDRTTADQVIAANVARECLLAALKADSKAAHTWTNLANAYYLMGDHRSSAKCLEKAGKIEPNCLATRYAVGVHRIRDAERSQNPNEQLSWAGNEMASILREGDSTSIESPIAWAGLAMVHRAQHEIVAGFEIEHNELVEVKEHAIYSLKQAIAEDPADAVQWHQLGLHSLCSQQFRTSQKYLKAAVARRKDCTYAWSNLGISLQLSEESSPAEEVYIQALSLATSKQAHTIFSNLGNLYRQIKQYERAKAMFTKSLELQPGYAPALNNLGLVCVAEGKWEEAKNCFNKAIQADPLLDAAKSNMYKASSMFKMHTSMS
ncbi:uncharacterized protein [Nicotiana tomentosiformis]|uniref:uncharacterized protein isoform X6 n=1 Tax=Nicotiana tomentosiformis TaxID=4098 RepID=UPI00051BF686|nr:uncharacterized protein LOC104121068 isoform X5 [Nicotiana tomentosiformis]